MTKVKLNSGISSFSDPVTGLSLAPGEIKELPKKSSWITRNALKGGHIIKIEETEFIGPADVKPTEDEVRIAELLEHTRDEIMEEFDFLDEDHTAEATKKPNKAELVTFLLSIEGDYPVGE